MSGTLAVISQTGESLSFFDLATGARTSHLTNLISEPHEICLDAKRSLLYVSHAYRHGHYWDHGSNGHEISVVDIASRQVVGVIDTSPAGGPHGMYIHYESDVLYVSVEDLPDEEGGGVIGIDLATRKVVKSVPSGYTSHWFAMTPDAKKAYTCNKTASFISVLDLENQKMIGKIDVPGCEEPSVSPHGRFVYFPTPGFKMGTNPVDPRIEVIDTATDKIVASIKTGLGSIPVHVTNRGQILAGQYDFSGKDVEGPLRPTIARLAVYHPETYDLVGGTPVGLLPLTIRSSHDGKMGFVSNVSTGTVDVVDLESMALIRTLTVDAQRRTDKNGHVGAHGLAFIP